MDETLEECGKRVLKQETGISHIYMEQLYTFSDVNRDPYESDFYNLYGTC